MYDTPSEVAALVKAEYDITITPQLAQNYDPTKYAGRYLARKWRDLFEASRAAFLQDCMGISAANKAVRIKNLESWSKKSAAQGAYTHAADIQEKIAKELSNAYQHHFSLRHVGHAGGAVEQEVKTQSNVRVYIPWNQRDDYPEVPSSDDEDEELDGDGR
jgi:hypothetical protein